MLTLVLIQIALWYQLTYSSEVGHLSHDEITFRDKDDSGVTDKIWENIKKGANKTWGVLKKGAQSFWKGVEKGFKVQKNLREGNHQPQDTAIVDPALLRSSLQQIHKDIQQLNVTTIVELWNKIVNKTIKALKRA